MKGEVVFKGKYVPRAAYVHLTAPETWACSSGAGAGASPSTVQPSCNSPWGQSTAGEKKKGRFGGSISAPIFIPETTL